MKKIVQWLFGTQKQQLDIPVVIGSSNRGADKDLDDWCKIFDDMEVSPYIDIKQVRECDIIAILSWLSSNYHSPIKRDEPNYR